MNLMDHPDLADRLAAAYALGTLRGGARRRFEAQARRSPRLRANALAWQERFAALTEIQPAMDPSPNVWKRIENVIAAERPRPSAQRTGNRGWSSLVLWRVAAVAASVAAIGAVGVNVYLGGQLERSHSQLAQLEQSRATLAQDKVRLVSQLQGTPDLQYVAVLTDDRSAASVLVTFDPKHNTLTLKRLGEFQEGADKSLQLWALPRSGGPQSLGVLGSNPVVKLTAAESQVSEAPALAISLEPRGGVPGAGGPTGPVLFKGPLLRTP